MRKHLLIIATTLCLTGCSKNTPDDKKIIVAASSVPHAEILNNIKSDVDKEGYELIIREVSDYVTPNLMLDAGDVDANYFQHEPYLVDFNAKNNTNLVSAFKVHFEPMGIYSKKKTNIAKTSTKIAIPNDTSNGQRAKELIASIPEFNGCEFIELEAQTLPMALEDVDYAVINGNYALSAGVTQYCLKTEDASSTVAQTNANLVAIKSGNEGKPFVEVLKKCLLSEKTKTFIQQKYGSSVKIMF